MDFLKSLMIYMSALFMMGVENAELPDPATMPTVAPTVTVAAVDDTPVVTAVPEATEVPAPTMTPNSKYATLRSGDKSNNVKKMQQRLIELGYLKKGSADGKYGAQTVTAVKNFQRANGLTADGVAGKATLTRLYEDKNVVKATATATPTPKPTSTPKAAAQSTASAQQGEEIAAPAQATVAPQESAVKAGWYRTGATVLLNQTAVMVLEHNDGVTSSRGPAVYMHDGNVIVSLTELAQAAAWQLDSGNNGSGFTLKAAGYTVIVTGSGSSCTALADGRAVELGEANVYYADGEWLVDTAFLRQTLGAVSTWDQDENTLVLRVTEKSLAESDD